MFTELSQLSGTVKYIADELGQLDQVGRAVDEIGHSVGELRSTLQGIQTTVSVLLLATVAGLVAMLGTLRHWF
jgi:hypothetical protein